MKKYIGLFLVSTASLFAEAGSIILEPLKPGQCVAEPESKTYLNDPITNRVVQFSCHYKCLNQNLSEFHIPVFHQETVLASADQMNVMVCDQIRIDVIKSELGYVLDQTVFAFAFWAQTSPRVELRKWADEKNGRIPVLEYQALRNHMNKTLKEIALSYMPKDQSANTMMVGFCTELLEIANESEAGVEKIKYYIDLDQQKKEPQNMVERLVMTMLKTHGAFLF
ncbi:MAG: hypothetical protein A2622_05795 [Bdellovibrionales bacterium RIFCSPHIGHO2_01_FULL_40_29]|nr:MAG: hypothetical protein A2622_05795 [Bdellovibrionales bacterium RIFCSPHIGHO2_01_FULL_40_29]OFZ34967.1 MAG: hypothetical protein A3D17_06145 [Bdellovibrionales bacterium RIFCSPHIGHO2_02_FULL_40_15]